MTAIEALLVSVGTMLSGRRKEPSSASFQSLIDEFSKTGVASDKLLDMIKEFGGEDSLKAFEDLQQSAKDSGKTIGDLAKDSQDSAKIIETVFDRRELASTKPLGTQPSSFPTHWPRWMRT